MTSSNSWRGIIIDSGHSYELTDGESLQEWQALTQEASRKIWIMWSDNNSNETRDSEKACFMTNLRKEGAAEAQILILVEKAETLIQQNPLRHIAVYIAEIVDVDKVETVKRLDAGGRRNFFRWSGLLEGTTNLLDT